MSKKAKQGQHADCTCDGQRAGGGKGKDISHGYTTDKGTGKRKSERHTETDTKSGAKLNVTKPTKRMADREWDGLGG